jgi:hypothetical protein
MEGFEKLFRDLIDRVETLERHQIRQDAIIMENNAKIYMLCRDGLKDETEPEAD